MLHVAGLVLKGQKPSSEDLRTTSLGQLSRTCVEAARRLLHVVSTLKKRQMLGEIDSKNVASPGLTINCSGIWLFRL